MLKLTKTYKDFNDVERTEDFYFNLTEAEITELEMGTTGGLTQTIERIVAAQDAPAIIKLFKEVVMKAYGIKSADGRRFIKNDAIREEFSQTNAYSMIFMELATDSDAASKFINGIVPASLTAKSSIPAPAAK